MFSVNKRYLGAILVAPFLVFLYIGGIYLKILTLILSMIGLYEFYSAVNTKDTHIFDVLGYVFCIIYYLGLRNTFKIDLLVYEIAALALISFCITVINNKFNFLDVSTTVLGFIYVPIFLSFITLTESTKYGHVLVWVIFISSWMCDTSAYYFGRFLGKRKLCPNISPNKTIAGAIGGLLGSTVACMVYGIAIRSSVQIPLYHFVIIGLLGGILGQFGDLTASSIKRTAKIKDFGSIIPGHGGILDRFDSILFTSFLVYYYISFILGL